MFKEVRKCRNDVLSNREYQQRDTDYKNKNFEAEKYNNQNEILTREAQKWLKQTEERIKPETVLIIQSEENGKRNKEK